MGATEYPEDAIASVQMGDSPSIDAFSRSRVSAPQHIFDVNFVYDLQPLQFEAITAESGARGKDVIAKFPITLNAAGAVRSLGTVTVLVSGIGAASACQVSTRWREVR